MGKVNVALRGWRFDEAELFDDEGQLRPLDQLSADTRDRLVRLTVIAGEPCDACWLEHGDEQIEECNVARAVYGEPLAEVVLCTAHELDFLYWFREAGGAALAGEDGFDDAFHEWFLDGNRAPGGYGGIEHVDTDPDSVPQPEPEVAVDPVEEQLAELEEEELEALDVDLEDLDV